MRAVRMSRPREIGIVRTSLPQQRASALGIALHERMLGQLAQVVSRDAAALELHRRRQIVKNLQRIGPVALLLVDAHQVIERGLAIFARGGQLLQQPLRAVHEAGAQVVERKGKRRLVAQSDAALLSQAGMDGDGAINLAAAAEQASERELDFGRIAIRLRHAREDLGGMIEAIVDEVIEADVVIARQTDGARGALAAP